MPDKGFASRHYSPESESAGTTPASTSMWDTGGGGSSSTTSAPTAAPSMWNTGDAAAPSPSTSMWNTAPQQATPTPSPEPEFQGVPPLSRFHVPNPSDSVGTGPIKGPFLTYDESVALWNEDAQKEVDETNANIDRALTTLSENPSQGALARDDWNTLAEYAMRLSYAEEPGGNSPETQEDLDSRVDYLTQNYPDQIKRYTDDKDPSWWEDNFREADKGNIFQQAAGKGQDALGAFAGAPIISQIFQGIMWSEQQVLVAIDNWRAEENEFYAHVEELSGNQEGADAMRAAPYFGRTDPGEDGRLNPRNAFGMDGDAGGVLGDLFDFSAGIVLSPATWTGLGPAHMASVSKASVRVGAALEGRVQEGAELLLKLSRTGTKSFSPAEEALYLRWGATGVAEGQNAVKSTIFVNRGPEALAQRSYEAASRSGRRGIRVGGRTVLPTSGINPVRVSSRAGSANRISTPVNRVIGGINTRLNRMGEAVFGSVTSETVQRVTPQAARATAKAADDLQARAAAAAADAESLAARVAADAEAKVAATAAENLAAARKAATLVDPTDLKTTVTGLPMPSGAAGNRFARPSVARAAEREAEDAYQAALKLNTSADAAAAKASADAVDFAAARRAAVPNNPVLGDPSKLTGFRMPARVTSSTVPPKRLARTGSAKAAARAAEEAYVAARKVNDDLAEALGKVAGVPSQLPKALKEVFHDLDEVAGTLPVEITETIKRGLVGRISDTKTIGTLRHMFIPRNRQLSAANRAERAAADFLENAVSTSKAKFEMNMFDATVGLNKSAVRAATKEWADWDSLNVFLNKAMSSDANYKVATSILKQRGTGKAATRKLLKSLGQADDLINASLIRSGVSAAQMRQIRNYIPRITDPGVRKDIERFLEGIENITEREAARDALRDMGFKIDSKFKMVDEALEGRDVFGLPEQGGSLIKRELAPNVQDLYEVNHLALKQFDEVDVLKGFEGDLFSTDVVAAVATRATSAFKSEMLMDLVDDLARFSDASGRKYAYVARNSDEALAVRAQMSNDGIKNMADYASMDIPGGGAIFLNKGMYDEINEVRMFLSSTADMARWKRNLSTANAVWATQATVLLPTNLAHHIRNETGNIFLATLAGVDNPALWPQMARLQTIQKSIRSQARKTGSTWDEAARVLKVSDIDTERIRLIRSNGVIGTNQIDDLARLEGEGGRLGKALLTNPLSKKSRELGATLENNTRMVVFQDGLNKGMSPASAAARMRKYMIDYSDLTSFESGNARIASRFYTFFRKNLAIQASALVQFPGRVVNAQKVMEGITDLIAGSEIPTPKDMILPDWAVEHNMRLRQADGWWDDLFGNEGLKLAGVDTPLVAAANNITSILSGVAAVPYLERVMPSWVTYGERKDRFSRAMGLFSGVPDSFIAWAYENLMEVDSFTGAPLEDGEAFSLENFLSIGAPIVDKATGMWDKWTDEDSPAGKQLLLTNYFNGIRVYDWTDKKQAGTRNRLIAGFEESMADLRQSRPDLVIPSMKDIQDAGWIPLQSVFLDIRLTVPEEEQAQAMFDSMPAELQDSVCSEFGVFCEFKRDDAGSPGRSQVAIALDVDNNIRTVNEARDRRGLGPISEAQEGYIREKSNDMPSQAWFIAHGADPGSDSNQFIPPPDPPTDQEEMDAFNAIMGWATSIEEYAEMHPMLSDIDQALADKEEAGMSDEDFNQFFVDEFLNRTEKANLPAPFGLGDDAEFPLDAFRDGTITPEFEERFRIRIWEQRSTAKYFYAYFLGREATEQEKVEFAYKTVLPKWQQELLGWEEGAVVPRTTDIQTDDQKYAGALTLGDIVDPTGVAPRAGSAPASGGAGGIPSFSDLVGGN
jgi:hypothetical protein